MAHLDSVFKSPAKTPRLSKAHQTKVKYLSGGECKKLSIALELIDNPVVASSLISGWTNQVPSNNFKKIE